MIRTLSSLALWGALALGPAAAQAAPDPPATLSLDDAIARALAQNPALQAADAGRAAAEAEAGAARGFRLPSVDLSVTGMRTTNPVFVFGNLLGQRAFGPANFDPAFLNEPPPLNNWNTKLAVTQPVFTGGKLKHGIEAADRAAEAAGGDREAARQAVVHGVAEAYSGTVLAERQRRVALEARSTALAHEKLVADLRQAGLVVESDLLQARVRVSETEEAVIRAEAGVAVAHAALNAAMGDDLDAVYAIPDAIAVPEAGAGSLAALTQEALDKRPDLVAARARAAAARSAVRVERAGRLPEVAVGGQYEANNESFIGTDGTNWSLMLAARFSLFDGQKTRYRVLQATERGRQADAFEHQLELQAGLEVRRAYHELAASRQSLEQARRAVALAEESLRIVEDRYKEGLTTLVELLSGQTALTAARTREAAAERDLLLADYGLKLATGRL